jgi:hypothetical protein
MRTWKFIVVGMGLSLGLIVAIANHGSTSFEHGRTVADQPTNSHQQIQQISTVARPVALVEKVDTSKVPDAEPWGPFRSVDW